MAFLVLVVLFFAMTGRSSALYCTCKDGLSESVLQKALDYACGAGGDCTPILQSGACYQPNTVADHCNYAVNSYFQRKGQVSGSCDFAGAATTTTTSPSKTSTCVFPASASSTTPSTTTPTTPSTTTPTTPATTTPSTTTPSTTTPSTTTPVYGIAPTTTTTTGSPYTDSSSSRGIASMVLCLSGLILLWG